MTALYHGKLMEKDRKNAELLRKKELQVKAKEEEVRDLSLRYRTLEQTLETAQQRTKQGGDAAGQAAGVQDLHDAAPKAEDAGHRKAQLQSGLGTVQRGGGNGAEVPVKKTPEEGEDH